MENLNLEVLQILIFLLPGFIAASLLDAFIPRKKKELFEKIIEALIFSMVIYILFSLFGGTSPIFLKVMSQGDVRIYSIEYNRIAFWWLFGLSIFLPALLGLLFTFDLLMKLARFFRLTRRTGRNSVWLEAFSDTNTHIIINFKDGRRIYGWPMHYADDPEKPYLFLYRPLWINEKNEFIESDLRGMLITPEDPIEFIEFLDR